MAVRSQAIVNGQQKKVGFWGREAAPDLRIVAPAEAAPAESRAAAAEAAPAPSAAPSGGVFQRAAFEASTPTVERLFAWFVLAFSFVSTGIFLQNGGDDWTIIIPKWAGGAGIQVGFRFFLGLAIQGAATYIEWAYHRKNPLLYWFAIVVLDMGLSIGGVHGIIGYIVERMVFVFTHNVLVYASVGWFITLWATYLMARYPEPRIIADAPAVA
jgi:hypothetical protein